MVELADPYSPIVYFLHTIVGSIGVLLALIALGQKKGGTGHMRSGWGFVIAVCVAACTAIVFSATEPSPLSIASALMVLGLVWGAILALRPQSPRVRWGEWGATGLMAGAWLILVLGSAFGVALALHLVSPPPGAEPPPLAAVLLPLAYGCFPTWFLIDDRRTRRRTPAERRAHGFRRHLSRMAFALAIAVHAPVVSFADDVGLHPLLAFFGPFVIWPVIMRATRDHPLIARAREPG